MNRRHSILLALSASASVIAIQPYRPVAVCGTSMSPTYEPGTLTIGSTDVGALHRSDVVVVQYDGKAMIKRVAYLPGDRITQYRIADTWFEPRNSLAVRSCERMRRPCRKLTIPPGMVYVVGDSDQSLDSRTFGPVPIAKVALRIVNPRKRVFPIYGLTSHR